MTIDPSRLDPSLLRLRPASWGAHPTNHFVEFYDDDASLVGSVATFVSTGISQGDGAVVIADAAHVKAIEAELSRSVDVEAARARGQYRSLDAEETLALFMDDRSPDPVRFERVIEGVLDGMSVGDRRLRIFGEMVGVLWSRGDVQAAIALEDLWNDFMTRHPFRLFCGYPAHSPGADQASLGNVCDRHSHVLVPRGERP